MNTKNNNKSTFERKRFFSCRDGMYSHDRIFSYLNIHKQHTDINEYFYSNSRAYRKKMFKRETMIKLIVKLGRREMLNITYQLDL